ncbi:MAG: hypothetical protein M1840_005417 [Geoglossum simile]|nr:MAG: hypothetical protein M1840_005417 [Geoglossum simile]
MTETKNLFIPIPGTVTGDLWHLAAAHILSKRYPIKQWELVTVVVLTDGGEDDEELHGRATFNYLRDLDLPCMVIKIFGLPKKASKKLTELAVYQVGEASLSQTWLKKKYSKLYFDDEVAHADTYKVSDLAEESLGLPYKRAIPDENSSILQLMTATTIAIQILIDKPAEFEDRKKYLRENMVPQPKTDIYNKTSLLAEEKWNLLKACIESQQDYLNSKVAGVLLYLNRKNPQANANTNSSEEILKQVKSIAGEKNLVVQVVAVGADPAPGDFDLFNKSTGIKYPGLNPCATAIVWSKVAQAGTAEGAKTLGLAKPIFGIFSGRTGSIDLPAFCGVNCFFWDEPWLQAAGDKSIYINFGALSMFHDVTNEPDKEMDGQISQCLRSLELYPIMATGLAEGLVDIKAGPGQPKPGRTYGMVRLEEVNQWLDKTKERGTIYPPAPAAQTVAPNPFQFYRKSYLEREAYGIIATALDKANYV